MKRTFLFLTIVSLLFSCSNDNNNTSSNNNGNSFTNSMDYEFTITINGVVHKVKGNTTNGIPYGTVNSGVHYINNMCTAFDNSGNKSINLQINDITESNYISGQNIRCLLSLNNLLTGSNQIDVSFFGSYFDTLYTNIGQTNLSPGILIFQTASGPENMNLRGKLPITITDLGTGTNFPQTYPLPLYNFGQTLKGNYLGTIYLRRMTSSGNITFDIPVQLSIDFKALRMY